MSNSSPLKDAADAAEAELKPLVGVTASSKYPYLHLPRLLPKCAALRDRWLEDPANLERVRVQTGKDFKSNPNENVHDTIPVVFANTPLSGFLPGHFPNKYLVIIAIGDLNQNNGVAVTERDKLGSGEYVIFPGHQALWFNGKGGGLALFLVLSL